MRRHRAQNTFTDERRAVVVASVWVADEAEVGYAAQRWGDLVELRGLLRPSSPGA
jgi:hypothetical protein